ncbi:MAG: hypothetical protein ACXWEW_07145, partial [Nitrososphaeraceae archaeon]
YSRKVKFYLDYEGRGKANLFYSLFKRRSLISQLDLNKNKFDYSIIYMLLSEFGISSVKNTYLYKRDHPLAAGNMNLSEKKMYLKLIRKLFPISIELFHEYYKSSNTIERVLISVLLPIKFLISYFWIGYSYNLKLRSREISR